MSVARRLLLILSVVVCCAGCDRVAKSYAEARLPKTHALSFVAGSLRLQISHNEGAFLSLGGRGRTARQPRKRSVSLLP